MNKMASLIPGYEYDIFISYRQKDNKHDGWVTEFVDQLKGELESTFKEEVSVYFDINPHDGLLETHEVGDSLKEKLRCLVFIPIISRTYCDPKSFAWEHEFKAFVEQASNDQFGLKIKLPNGNVASRVLPIRIHDLDIADIRLCEDILGGVLRGVEFIYREPGVNRSLTPDDDEKVNLNKTRYRNQINKVALAINEIIQGLKTEPEWVRLKDKIDIESFNKSGIKEASESARGKNRSFLNRILFTTGIIIILAVTAIIFFPRISRESPLDKLRSSGTRISIAVMPFQNITGDTAINRCQRWIQYNLINSLSGSEELLIRQTETINNLIDNKGISTTSLTPNLAGSISRKLDADILIFGSIGQAVPVMRVYVQLIDTKTEEVLKTFQTEGSEDNILRISDTFSTLVKNFLVVSGMKQGAFTNIQLPLVSTNSPEAFNNYLSGVNAFSKTDFDLAIEFFLRALEEDQNFTFVSILLTWSYLNTGQYDKGKECHLKAYDRKDILPVLVKTKLEDQHAFIFEGSRARIKFLEQFKNIDDQDSWTYFDLGHSYMLLGEYEKAIPEYEKALELFDSWDMKPWPLNYVQLGYSYHQTAQYKKEIKLYRKAEKDFPDHYLLLMRQAVLALTMGESNKAKRYIDKYVSVRKDKIVSEADMASELAELYSGAGISNKAEEYYRKALSMESENPEKINDLSFFLIDKEGDITEGLELIEKVLALSTDNFQYLDTRGWGLYKQGKFQEAMEVLQGSWDMRMQKAIYNHAAHLRLEEAKKAAAGQK